MLILTPDDFNLALKKILIIKFILLFFLLFLQKTP